MKKITIMRLLAIMIALGLANMGLAQSYNYSDSWGKAGFSVVSTDAAGVKVNYSITEFSISDMTIDNEAWKNIELPGTMLPNDEGAPNLPGGGRYIAIPQGANVHLKVSSYRTEKINDISLAPSPRIPWDTDEGPLSYVKDNKIYSNNAFYPEKPFSISEKTSIRGVDAVILGVTPFQYNPVTRELIVYRDIELELTFEGGNSHIGDDRLRSRWFDPILRDALLNNSMLPEIDYEARTAMNSRDEDGCEYLIVSPDGEDFQRWADSIKQFRTLQGIKTDIVTLSEIGGNSSSILENYFNDAYANWTIPPVAVLLLGDYGDNMENSVSSPIWDSYCVSDNIYADVTNNDMPDIIFARMTANNNDELETMVTKFINYERNPPTSPDFYNHPITALGWQTERWFQICSETIGGYFKEVHGKDPVRINAVYGGNPNSDPWSTATNTSTVVNYFGPDGLGYIPGSPSELGGWSGGTNTMVTNAINDGAFLLQHRDHGGETGWGEPDYSNSDINNLTNTDLTFIFSINCLTGKYNWNNECFAEKFHRHRDGMNNAGALGIIAASEVSYSFVNDTYVWGMYDNMWPDFMPDYGTPPESRDVRPAFGNAGGKYFLQQSQWPYNTDNKEVTYNLFHHHGDAFLMVYSEVPQELSVTHNPILYSGNTSFSVTADEGSFIALTVNGEIIGTAESTGGPVQIEIEPQLPPNTMVVTITKQNYYRYTANVDVIPPEGPYVVYNDLNINDAAGNNNGMADFGEDILLGLSLKNVGIEEAQDVNVSIASDDPYITITDADEAYGNINPDAVVTMDDSFGFTVSDSVPDNYLVNFSLAATDVNDTTWTTYFSLRAWAPVLEKGRLLVMDPSGNNNGRLDPGETADLYITTFNIGHADINDLIATIGSSSQYVTLNNTTVNVEQIAAGGSAEVVFNITVDEATPAGTAIDLNYHIESGFYSLSNAYFAKVGIILEDWESGTFDNFDWYFGGNSPWNISDDNPYEGSYCVKSGSINDQQSTQFLIDYNVAVDDSISFYAKVSSEDGYDYLMFYIDGDQKGAWAGEMDWTYFAYPISAGEHTLRWTYNKDYSVSNGQDCGWIDFIVLPPELRMTAYAGPDMDVCAGDDCSMSQANASMYESMEWTTSGSGVFDDNSLMNPVYTPSDDDITAGNVVLTFTVHGAGEDVSDDVVISIMQEPLAFAGNDAAVCGNEGFLLNEATAENYSSIEWTSDGDGSFDDISLLNPVYTPGANDIINGTAMLTLTAANAACEPAVSGINITINPLPEPLISGETETCAYNTYTYSTAEVAGNSYEWTVNGGSIVEGQGSATVSIEWGDAATASLMLTETIEATLCQASDEMEIIVNPAPMPAISGPESLCEGDNTASYQTEETAGNTYLWTVEGGEITEGQNSNQIIVEWTTPGQGMVYVTETMAETGCANTAELMVEVNALPMIMLGNDTSICHNHVLSLDAGNPDAMSWVWSTGETTQTISIDSTGAGIGGTKEISVVVTSAQGCVNEDMISVYFEDCSGIAETIPGLEMNIYPNPSDGSFTIDLNLQQSRMLDISIMNSLGKLVYEEKQIETQGAVKHEIDLPKLPEGMYYLSITSGSYRNISKLIINK